MAATEAPAHEKAADEPASTDVSTKAADEHPAAVTANGTATATPAGDAGEGAVAEKAAAPVDESEYPTGLKLVLIVASLCLAVFLVALDQTIIAPALGAITTQFQSVKDIVRFPSLCAANGFFAASVC